MTVLIDTNGSHAAAGDYRLQHCVVFLLLLVLIVAVSLGRDSSIRRDHAEGPQVTSLKRTLTCSKRLADRRL